MGGRVKGLYVHTQEGATIGVCYSREAWKKKVLVFHTNKYSPVQN